MCAWAFCRLEKVMAVIKTVNAAAEKALVEVRAAVKQAGASGVVMPVAP